MKLQLNEDIYGRQAIVYHRTHKKETAHIILHNEFISKTAMYGPGIYTTYYLSDQQNERMAMLYGDFIIKIHVKIVKFLILDWSVFVKQPEYTLNKDKITVDNFIIFQLWKYTDIPRTDKKLQELMQLIKKNRYFTSDIAHALRDIAPKYFNGLIFTGSRDGHVMVIYNHRELAVPLSISVNDGETFIPIEEIKNHELFKTRVKNQMKKSVNYDAPLYNKNMHVKTDSIRLTKFGDNGKAQLPPLQMPTKILKRVEIVPDNERFNLFTEFPEIFRKCKTDALYIKKCDVFGMKNCPLIEKYFYIINSDIKSLDGIRFSDKLHTISIDNSYFISSFKQFPSPLFLNIMNMLFIPPDLPETTNLLLENVSFKETEDLSLLPKAKTVTIYQPKYLAFLKGLHPDVKELKVSDYSGRISIHGLENTKLEYLEMTNVKVRLHEQNLKTLKLPKTLQTLVLPIDFVREFRLDEEEVISYLKKASGNNKLKVILKG